QEFLKSEVVRRQIDGAVAGINIDAAGNRDHRVRPSAKAATAAFTVDASTAPVIRIRAPANSISIAPLLAGLVGSGVTSGSETNFAGTKPNCVPLASFGSG